ncbi:MAG: MotA/TolQ/ExbB proton channel family protein [Sphingomonadales bacterium]|nr:MotA/TolQ/ExbB proton channel family protein [Sphingomonadales bacterium]
MNLAALLDGPSAAIVFGGTATATLLRCGVDDVGRALHALATLGSRNFDAERVRAEMAVQVQEILKDGLIRAAPHRFDDAEFDEATGALIAHRSLPALLAAHEKHKRQRQHDSAAAVRTLAQASELAPVFGLAGTLISLSQLPVEGLARGAFTGAISMAVLTTLYGLLAANLLLAPLARMVDRAAQSEEAQRQKVVDWLAAQVAGSLPPGQRGPETAREAA